jgi:hypothetical protein
VGIKGNNAAVMYAGNDIITNKAKKLIQRKNRGRVKKSGRSPWACH